MMGLRHQLAVIALLSLATAGGGILLARARHLPETDTKALEDSPRVSSDRIATASSTTIAGKKEPGIRSPIATASIDVLWEWLAAHATEEKDGSTRYDILVELYARDGLSAWTRLLEGEDVQVREKLSDGFLGMISNSDPWLSHELFLKNKDAFGKRWGVSANTNTLQAACAISAEKYIEVMDQSGYGETRLIFYEELPAGFDFARLVTHLATSELRPAGLPNNLIGQWAKQSPKEAAAWLAAQPKVDENGPMVYLLEEDRALPAVFLSLADTTAPGREEGLAAFSAIPAARIDKAWDRLAENQEGKISPGMLDAATRTGSRDAYLMHSLLHTRGDEKPDASWLAIPEQDRRKAMDLAERRWKEEASSPVDEKARQEWRARLQKAWSEGK